MSTTEELNLPRWAATLLAARSARPLLRLLPDVCPGETADELITCDRVAMLHEQSAEAGRARDDLARAAVDAEAITTRQSEPFLQFAGKAAACAARAALSEQGAANTSVTYALRCASLAYSSILLREI